MNAIRSLAAAAAAAAAILLPAQAAQGAPQFIDTQGCQEHQAFVDGDANAVARRLPQAYTPVTDGPSGPPLLFVRALKCQSVTLDGRTAPATMASFGVVVDSPDGRGCASGAPGAGGTKGDEPPLCNWYALFWLANDTRVVDWLKQNTPGFPAVYVSGLKFDLGPVDPAQGGAPLHVEAPKPSPSPFTIDEVARERPGELSVRGGYWNDTPQGTVKLAFSTEDLTSGDASGTVHAQPGSEMATLFGADDRAYAADYSSLSAERWAHASYRKQIVTPTANTHSFDGSCSLQGTSKFNPPATNTQRPLTYTYDGSGTCTGTLDGHALDGSKATMHDTGPANGSCPRAVTTSPGLGTITFANGATIPLSLDFNFAGTDGDLTFYGERSGTATAHGTFATQRTTPDVVANCGGSGAASAPLDINLTTQTPLVSQPPQPPPHVRTMRLSASPRKARAGKRTTFSFHVTTGHNRPVRGASVRFAGHTLRTGPSGRASVTLTLRRPGRRTARATKPGFTAARVAIEAS
jgi:hypothetical protein